MAWGKIRPKLVSKPSRLVTSVSSALLRVRAAVTRLVKSLRTGHEAREEIELATPGGHTIRLQLSAYPVPGHSGAVVWCTAEAGPTYDPLGLMQGQRGLLSAIFDAAPVGLMLLGPEERVLFVNETLAGWLGYTPADMLTAEMRLGDLAALKTSSQLPGEAGAVDFRGRDGLEVTFRVSTSQVKRADDSLFGTVAAAEQDTREGGQDETLFAIGNRFRHFFDHAPVGIVMLDHEGAVTATNAAFHALAGAGQGLEGAPFTQLLYADDARDVEQLMATVRRNGMMPAPREVRLAGEPERVAQLFLRAVGRDAGAGFIAYLVDLTEQKNLERQFVRSQKMQAVGQLAGGIAHDFNNLLTAMIGFCDLLLLRHQVGDQSFADIMQIKQNANRAANLVRQLLAFSRQQTLQPKVLGLTDVLAELSHLLQRLMGENIELRIVHGRDVGLVKVDQGQLEQVVINLAVNARDAMPDGGILTIRTSNATREDETEPGADLMPPDDFLLIEVGDTGRGIPDEHLDKIFEPFFTTKEAGAGIGLGLSTVYGIIKQTGGFIFVANGPSKGATFRIYLPRYHAVDTGEVVPAEAASGPAPDLTGTGTLLVVEDEDPVRLFAVRALRNKGYTVLHADSGDAALEIIGDTDQHIDMLITDVGMPHMDGPTLARQPALKVLLISGYAEDASFKSPDAGAEFPFLPKPFTLKDLAGKVKEVLTAPAA